MKKLFAFVILLTSSLAGVAENVADSENKYYAGLNFGAGWGDGFKMEPGVVFGYRYNKKSQFELEVLSEVWSLKNIGASLLANYRYYPNLDTNPMKLYVGVGLGGYLQIVPFGFGSVDKKVGKPVPPEEVKDNKPPKEKENEEPEPEPEAEGEAIARAQAGESVEELKKQVELLKDAKEAVENMKEIEKLEKQIKELEKLDKEIGSGIGTVNLSLADKILGSISYKLKVGVDYEITPQIVGAVGITMGGQLSGLKALKMPDATLEVGIRYNF